MNQTTQGTVDAWGDQWMRFFWRTPPADLGERCRRRVALHLIPFLFFLYILAYLDRTNISAAAGAMEASVAEGGLGFSRSTIALASGMFFWGYLILEVPSTIFVERFGVRYVFVRILVLWGITATLMGYVGMPAVMDWIFGWLPSSLPTETSVPFLGTVNEFINSLKTSSENQLHVLRFMLGFFEGGFFPCVIVYLGHWFRPQDRAKAIATFMAAIPFTSVIGYPVSYLILQYMHNVYGLAGWRWVFILEGIVPIFAGIATLFMLPARPHQSAWLPDDEKQWLLDELEKDHRERAKHGGGHGAFGAKIGLVLLLIVVYFGLNVFSYGLQIFMPAIIKAQTGLSSNLATALAAVPYIIALIGMLINGWHSDKTQERIWHVALPLATAGIGLYLVALTDDFPLLNLLLLFVMVGVVIYAHLPAFWPIPTMFLGPIAAAGAIGIINTIGNLGGFFGPTFLGASTEAQVSQVFVEPDGRVAATSADRTVKLWDPMKHKVDLAYTLNHPDAVLDVAASVDRSTLASACRDGSIRLWNTSDGKLTDTLTTEGTPSPVHRVLFSPDGKHLASGGADKKIRVWELETRKIAMQLEGHGKGITGLAFDPKGSRLASSSADGTARVWDLAKKAELVKFSDHNNEVTSVAFSKDGEMVASTGRDKRVRLWNSKDGKEIQVLQGHKGVVNQVLFNPDGKTLASAGTDREIILWDLEGKEVKKLSGHMSAITGIAFNSDGSALASGSEDQVVKLWTLSEGTERFEFKGRFSFANGLMMIAPWPLLSAIIILGIRYFLMPKTDQPPTALQ